MKVKPHSSLLTPHSALLTLLTASVLGGCVSLPPSELEEIRDRGECSRTHRPYRAVGGYGCVEQAMKLIATGESEEIDYWRLTQDPSKTEREQLRKAFDAAGGRGVQILGPGETYVPRAYAAALRPIGETDAPVLLTGTDRVMIVNSYGLVQWEKRTCGNVHSARRIGNFIYYSNGSIYRVPLSENKWLRPQRVWRAKDATGGGALCFDVTPAGNLVFAVNSTGEVIEYNPQTETEIVRFKVDCGNEKNEMPPPHGRLRAAHRNSDGTYTVSCAGAQMVRVCESTGTVVKTIKTPNFTFDAVMRPNGNIVVSHVSGITEYNGDEIVWQLTPDDLPELGVANFTSLQVLPDGNLVIGTWANGATDASRVGAFEVTPDKRVVWAFASATDINMMGAFKLSAE